MKNLLISMLLVLIPFLSNSQSFYSDVQSIDDVPKSLGHYFNPNKSLIELENPDFIHKGSIEKVVNQFKQRRVKLLNASQFINGMEVYQIGRLGGHVNMICFIMIPLEGMLTIRSMRYEFNNTTRSTSYSVFSRRELHDLTTKFGQEKFEDVMRYAVENLFLGNIQN